MRVGWLQLVIVLSAIVAWEAAFAESAHVKKAKALEAKGLPLDAAKEFEAAWKETRVPMYLFRAARALEAAGDPEAAVRFYTAYLVEEPEAINRKEVEARITALSGPSPAAPAAGAPAADLSVCEVLLSCAGDTLAMLRAVGETKTAAKVAKAEARWRDELAAGSLTEEVCARRIVTIKEGADSEGISMPATCSGEMPTPTVLVTRPLVLRIRSAKILPAKADGRKWDGLGKAAPVLLSAMDLVLKGSPYTIVLSAVAKAISIGLFNAIEPPDPFIKVFLNGKPILETATAKNSLTPIWDDARDVLVANPTTDLLEFSVWDRDLEEFGDKPDPIGTCTPHRGVTKEELASGAWIIQCRNQIYEIEVSLREAPKSVSAKIATLAAAAKKGKGSATVRGSEPAPEPEPEGTLSAEVIARTVDAALPRLRSCYDDEARRHPDLAGRVVARFIVTTSGGVRNARILESTLGSPAVEGCVLATLSDLDFSPPTGGVVTVEYPFVFKGRRDHDGPKDPFGL